MPTNSDPSMELLVQEIQSFPPPRGGEQCVASHEIGSLAYDLIRGSARDILHMMRCSYCRSLWATKKRGLKPKHRHSADKIKSLLDDVLKEAIHRNIHTAEGLTESQFSERFEESKRKAQMIEVRSNEVVLRVTDELTQESFTLHNGTVHFKGEQEDRCIIIAPSGEVLVTCNRDNLESTAREIVSGDAMSFYDHLEELNLSLEDLRFVPCAGPTVIESMRMVYRRDEDEYMDCDLTAPEDYYNYENAQPIA